MQAIFKNSKLRTLGTFEEPVGPFGTLPWWFLMDIFVTLRTFEEHLRNIWGTFW